MFSRRGWRACQFLRAASCVMSLPFPARTMVALKPMADRCLAATKPSPPFPPKPQKISTVRFWVCVQRVAISVAMLCPAFSMSWSREIPKYSALVSRARMCLLERVWFWVCIFEALLD